jgi:signal transduction histidine kinase
VSLMLPLKPSSRALIIDVARALQPHFPQISDAWRRKMEEEFAFDQRTLAVLERLNLSTCYGLFSDGDWEPFFENLTYFGTRLAKLQVDTRAVARSLEFCQAFCERHLQPGDGEQRAESRAALETLSSATFVTVSGAYFDSQRRESQALLSVLDAELTAGDLQALLDHVLKITTATFNSTLGLILLRDNETDTLRAKALFGFEQDEIGDEVSVAIGQGFSGNIAQTGEPAMLPDLAQSKGVLNPFLRRKARALWGVPLKTADRVIGVLLIGFGKPYEWLPTELELMRAIADRSALAIDRAGMTDALKEREGRIVELSGHLLQVQEDERKRISRELHDETGQSLMVIRLYLGMLEKSLTGRTAKGKVRETVTVVDRTIEGIRRIIGRLSPLVLQELGLIAAIRKEAKDLAKSAGVKARVAVSEDVGRLAPELETAIYRVVQEALHNVAKHAQAKTVTIQMARENGAVALLVEDDGVGIVKPTGKTGRQTFGLAGIKERIGMLGGKVRVVSAKGKGTRVEVTVPVESALEAVLSQAGVRSEASAVARIAAANGTTGQMH